MKYIPGNIRALALVVAAFAGLAVYSAAEAQQSSANEAKAPSLESVAEKDFDKAYEAAKKDGKILMIEFTGSQWCPPCKMLHKFVLNTDEFVNFAKKSIHVVVADFDRSGQPLDKEFSAQYLKLAEKYRLEGFPTIILINPKNDEIKKIVGLQFRTPQSLIKEIESIK